MLKFYCPSSLPWYPLSYFTILSDFSVILLFFFFQSFRVRVAAYMKSVMDFTADWEEMTGKEMSTEAHLPTSLLNFSDEIWSFDSFYSFPGTQPFPLSPLWAVSVATVPCGYCDTFRRCSSQLTCMCRLLFFAIAPSCPSKAPVQDKANRGVTTGFTRGYYTK